MCHMGHGPSKQAGPSRRPGKLWWKNRKVTATDGERASNNYQQNSYNSVFFPNLLSYVLPRFLSILPNLSSPSPISCNPSTKYPITCNTLLGLQTQTWLANDRKSTQRVEEEGELTCSCRRGGRRRCPCIRSSIPRRSRP
jgi:hypothetical protein